VDRTIVRRAFHLTSPVWLIWYWMPPDSWVGVPKAAVLLFFLCGALLIEAGRLIFGYTIPGLRDYESDRMSAYAWGSLGLTLGLLFFPGEIVIVTFWGMAWIDPLCGYARRRGRYPQYPVLAYLGLWLAVSLAVVPLAPYRTAPIGGLNLVLLGLVATALAIAVERPNLKYVDDDFLMHVVPMVALAAVFEIL